MKTHEQALTEWATNEVKFNCGFGIVTMTCRQMEMIHALAGAVYTHKHFPDFTIKETETYLKVEDKINHVDFMIEKPTIDRVAEFIRAGLLGNFSVLEFVRLGSLEAVYDAGITAAAMMKPGWDKVK